MLASDTAELSFTDVEVPVENLLGEEGNAFYYLSDNLVQERLIIAIGACASEIEAAQAMVDRAMNLHDKDELTAADAAKLKLFGTEMAGRVIDKCLQLHGDYGYMRDYPIARLYADTRVSRIYGGTNEVQKTVIAKSLGLQSTLRAGAGSARRARRLATRREMAPAGTGSRLPVSSSACGSAPPGRPMRPARRSG
ncbi:acyl-CoA dehydrogenase family protein [Saccharopolyspora elongata]|uniref:acyl-CoA dehydrogenase family protein n=1 Tax=Saccharopolyspora elongata TaxID=2530387 RepID=UPI001A9CFEE8|nr:acyl-CoA dehydrogenase family protein [Saccharopolyspora elongata]